MAVSGPTQAFCFVNDDTQFRAWAQVIHDKLAAVGLVQTSDTGQINLATVAKPGAANTPAGYEIWRFADALQATAPIFIKVEYGTAAAATTPSIWITVGQSTNGAGTITGVASTRTQMIPSASTIGTTKAVYCSGSTNRVWLAAGIDWVTAANSYFFCVERTRDAAGVDTADGFFLQMNWSSSSGSFMQTGLWAGGASVGAAIGPLFPINISASRMAVGPNVGLVPGLFYQGKPFYPVMLGAQAADIPGNLTYIVDYLGGDHTYLSLAGAINTNVHQSGSGSFSAQMLWE